MPSIVVKRSVKEWREIEEAAPFGALGVDGGQLGELLGAHGLLGLQDLGQRRRGAGAAAAGGEEEPRAVDGAAVAVLGARRRRALGGAVAVGARGGAGGGDLLDVHEGGEEVVLGADLVEAVAAGPAAAAEVEVVREAEGDLRSGPAVVRPGARGGRGWRRREGRPPRRIGGLRLLHCAARWPASRAVSLGRVVPPGTRARDRKSVGAGGRAGVVVDRGGCVSCLV